jgi:hypothetical protein
MNLSMKIFTKYYFLLLINSKFTIFDIIILTHYIMAKATYTDLILTKVGAFHNILRIIFSGVVGGKKIA